MCVYIYLFVTYLLTETCIIKTLSVPHKCICTNGVAMTVTCYVEHNNKMSYVTLVLSQFHKHTIYIYVHVERE